MSAKQIMETYWPLATVVGVGLIGWGSLNADVSKLKEDAANAKSDHDLIVEMRTEQSHIRDDIKEIKDALRAPNPPRNR
jgi:hypothetical protein